MPVINGSIHNSKPNLCPMNFVIVKHHPKNTIFR